MPEDQLFENSLDRLKSVISLGVGAIEIKSGYGLSKEGEEKDMLRVIKRLEEGFPIPIKATFLGCHAVPSDFNSAKEYTEYVVTHMLPEFVEKGLVDYVDAFCETGYFSVDGKVDNPSGFCFRIESKIHVNQLLH